MTAMDEILAMPGTDADRLVDLHVRIAQRADQLALAREGPRSRETDLQCWMEAEREILGEEWE